MFDIPLFINLFTSLIELSNKRTRIPLLINLFISLIELKNIYVNSSTSKFTHI